MHIDVTLSNHKDAFLLNNDIPSGVSFIMPEIIMTKSFDTDTAVTIIVSLATGVPSSLVAAWLYDKLKQGRSSLISINRREIHFSNGKVSEIIEEAINEKH